MSFIIIFFRHTFGLVSGRLCVSRSLTSVVSLKWLTGGITDVASVHIGALGPRTGNATEAVIDNIDCALLGLYSVQQMVVNKGKGSPYSITERRVPDLIPVLGSQPAGDVSRKPGGRCGQLRTRGDGGRRGRKNVKVAHTQLARVGFRS